MLKIFALAFLVSAVKGQFFSSCNLAGVVTPDHIVSDACPPGGNRCSVTRGQLLQADAYFTPLHAHNELITDTRAYHTLLPGGLNIPMTPPHDNACNDLYEVESGLQVGCPTTPNVRKIWKIELTVPTVLPALNNVRVRFLMIDGGVNAGCVDVMANIS